MCEPERPKVPFRTLIAYGIANYRYSGLPWYRVLYRAAVNYLRRARYLTACCGNLGEPGC